MKRNTWDLFISIVIAWLLITITKVIAAGALEDAKLLEIGRFNIRSETILMGVYTFVVYAVLGFKKMGESRTQNPNAESIEQRQKNLARVLEIAKERGQIANDIVEEKLGVSNATAERYLQELEIQGKLVQIGKTGINVVYKPIV